MPIERFVVERFTPADLMAVAAEPGGKVMIGHDLDPYGSGLERSAALQPWPSPRPGVQGARADGRRGSPGLHKRIEVMTRVRSTYPRGRLGIPPVRPCAAPGAAPPSNPPGQSEAEAGEKS
ncbi:hypothetical protein HED55_17335 [Ochrobactrum haematophilum]|uniref:Uncharacterized protein n=1 Tax=Brucella haematophila TaxID=419474 RepID=A0ABX1DN25_9HYPH|nr:hypothetical protein [Brucella haematophila]